jgi:uncharacterized protein YndB with AHSA1/START domain
MRSLQVAKSGENGVIITRSFDAPRELVWACHTQAELVRRWLLGPPGWTMPTCEIDLRVGGSYRYVWRNTQGVDMAMGGVYREIAAPELLVAAECFDDDWTGGETMVTQRFTEAGSGTLLTMSILYGSDAAREGALKTGMTSGMEMSYVQLDALLGVHLKKISARSGLGCSRG